MQITIKPETPEDEAAVRSWTSEGTPLSSIKDPVQREVMRAARQWVDASLPAPGPGSVLLWGYQADSDPEPWPWGDEGYMCPKMVRETLCVAQAAVGRSPEVDARRVEHVERISRLINLCDRHRPLGPDGKHGTRQCTPTCGCEDKREPITPVEPAVEPDTSDTLDFDAMPIGTVLWDDSGSDFLLRFPGGWSYNPPADEDDYYDIDAYDGPFTVVYQPAPVSPYEGLRAVLAGRTDADELIEYAAEHWRITSQMSPFDRLAHAVGDAARSGGAT